MKSKKRKNEKRCCVVVGGTIRGGEAENSLAINGLNV